MRRVVAAQNFNRAVGQSFQNRLAVARGAQWRVHFEIRVVGGPFRKFILESRQNFPVIGPKSCAAGHRRVGEREVMRAGLAGNRHAAFLRLAQQRDAARRAQVLAMDARAGEFGEQDVARDNHFLARRRPAAQAQHGAPITLVHHAVGHERIILAMVHHRQVEHFGVFARPAHEFVVLHAMAVVGDGHDAGAFERADGREFLAGDVFGDGPGHKDVDDALSGRRVRE